MKIEVKGKIYDTETIDRLIPLCGDFKETKNYYYEKNLFITFDGEYIEEVFERKVEGNKKPDVRHEVKLISQLMGEKILKASGFKLENLGLLRTSFSSPLSSACVL